MTGRYKQSGELQTHKENRGRQESQQVNLSIKTHNGTLNCSFIYGIKYYHKGYGHCV